MQTGDDRSVLLSTMPATRRDRAAALAVVGVSLILFACAVPFAGVPLAPMPAFVASYQSALAINDLITAVLLFSQFTILRSRALIMPGSMNGRQLADEALKRRPALKTLFTSGYTENAIVHHGRLDTGVLLLAKPYRKSDLARMIRLALGR